MLSVLNIRKCPWQKLQWQMWPGGAGVQWEVRCGVSFRIEIGSSFRGKRGITWVLGMHASTFAQQPKNRRGFRIIKGNQKPGLAD